jgi:hypothetical protein
LPGGAYGTSFTLKPLGPSAVGVVVKNTLSPKAVLVSYAIVRLAVRVIARNAAARSRSGGTGLQQL